MNPPSKRTVIDKLSSRSQMAICRDGIRRNSLRALTDKEVHRRFLKRILRDKTTKCWNWTGSSCGSFAPYGQMRFQNKTWKVHRYSYHHYNGEIPHGLIVRHKCDNSLCCNPRHLLVGTQKDNCMDAFKRGRARYGTLKGLDNPRTKITPAQALKVVELSSQGVLQREIITITGVGRSNVSAIVNGRTWSHVTSVPKS